MESRYLEIMMPDFSEVLGKIPDWKDYFTVDELHERSADIVNEYPNKIELIELGNSRGGEVIECLKIGEGRHNGLIYGFPNPEEPFGGNLLDYLSWSLAEDDKLRRELDYTWYLIKCIDPDGGRLNEGFHKGPFTPLNFTLNYYRTPNHLTGESCFPFRFGPLDLNDPVPETSVLMRLMDRIPFDFISSLHMMKWGGITFEVPEPCPELYAPFLQLTRDFRVFPRKRLGTTIAPGVQLAAYLTPARGYIKEWARGNTSVEPIRGCYAYEYGLVLNPRLFMMIPECCIWHDERMWNDSLSESTVGDLVRYEDERENEVNTFMVNVWRETEPHLIDGSPFKVMMDEWMEPIVKRFTNVTNPPFKFDENVHARRATVAEKIGMEGHADLYRMFYLGGMIRAFKHLLDIKGNSTIENAKDEVMTKIKEYDDFMNRNYDVKAHPIRNLVGVSLGSILHSAMYAVRRKSCY